jgi:hypothetical protein
MNTISRLIYFFLAFLSPFLVHSQYSGGNGSADSPYLISSLDDLKMLSDSATHWNRYFKLIQDIDASTTKTWNAGKGFNPIANFGGNFKGGFDGNNHSINNLFIDRGNDSYVGLFGSMSAGYIRNLTLVNCYINAYSVIGTLVGHMGSYDNEIPEVSNVSILGCKVNGREYVGGLVGDLLRGRIEDCSAEDTVIAAWSRAGGLVGFTYPDNDSWIRRCNVNTVVSGKYSIGGLVGYNCVPIIDCHVKFKIERTQSALFNYGGFIGENHSDISRCTAEGIITAKGSQNVAVGGFVGYNSGLIWDCKSNADISAIQGKCVGGFAGVNNNKILMCVSNGSVIGNTEVGGFAGKTSEGSLITNSYSTCHTTGNNSVGGFLGENSYFATCSNCYSAGLTNSIGWFSGGFIGLNRSTAFISSCFYDSETSKKYLGTGMDHNGQNQDPVRIVSSAFSNMEQFQNQGWLFGNTHQEPWRIGKAPDGHIRPVLHNHSYLVSFLVDTGGIIEPANNTLQWVTIGYNSNSVVASPFPDYKFYAWYSSSGDSITNKNPLIVNNVRQDSNLIAKFIYTVSISEIPHAPFTVFPNPATDHVIIQWEDNTLPIERYIILTDLWGREIITTKTAEPSFVINTDCLNSGTYILIVKSGTSNFSTKIVVK